ncbi:MAG TPA: DUF2807 domain-containing protein [Flavobacteriaceae bacterium]|nr:DUF2807 domain-containing protein [Flavobacteriaceae bacterium]
MRRIIALLKISFFLGTIFFLLQACNMESGLDCFKKQGEIITESVKVDSFSKVNISPGIELIVKQTETQSVKIEVGKNFRNDITWEVIDQELILEDESNCQMLRNYHPTKVYVNTPDLNSIYSSSQYNISSDGILRFPELRMESGLSEETSSGIWEMHIENQRIIIEDNVSAVYRIQGETEDLGIWFWGQNGRFEGAALKADEVSFYQRSANDMIVFPIHKITGALWSTGNVVLKNVPPEIDVEQHLSGHLVYP